MQFYLDEAKKVWLSEIYGKINTETTKSFLNHENVGSNKAANLLGFQLFLGINFGYKKPLAMATSVKTIRLSPML